MIGNVRTVCPYCGVGCGVIMTATKTGWTIRGDPEHPANRGRLCLKGVTLTDTLGTTTRLLHPIIDGCVVSWRRAIAETARRIRLIIDTYGPDSFAFYLSGQLLTEDYYAANKLAKGFLGTANVDSNSRLCMASAVAGHSRAFGSDTVPGCFDDIENASMVILVGSNLAWCHPVLFQRLWQAKKKYGTRVVVIDPRKTESCKIADIHLKLAPSEDLSLFNGLLLYLHRTGRINYPFVKKHTDGFSSALEAVLLNEQHQSDEIDNFYYLFSITERVVTLFSQGVNQSFQGTDTINAIINVHLATGRIGRPGMGPFSVTGQPNAMGGREVGGLANQLAAHMGFDAESIDRVRRFWQAPHMAEKEGLKAIDLFHAIDEGRVKAVWIMATNPSVSMPEANLVRRALAHCPVVIVSECVAETDTLRQAHICLPALAWGEKNGTVTNSDRTLSRQRQFLPCPGEARADWRAIADVAHILGYGAAFHWRSSDAVFDEYVRLTAFENEGHRDLDLSSWIGKDYENLKPTPWGGKRFFHDGRFFHKDRNARFIAIHRSSPGPGPSPGFPLCLNSGRYRDQWHSMGRTGLVARLFSHRPEPLLDMHPADSVRFGLNHGMLVQVESQCGDYFARVFVTTDQKPGYVFLPLHWNDVYAARAVSGRLYPAHADPISGQPKLKCTSVNIKPHIVKWSGLLVSKERIILPKTISWWVRYLIEQAHVIILASDHWEQTVDLLAALKSCYGPARLKERFDPFSETACCCWVTAEKQLVASLFLRSQQPDVAWTFSATRIGKMLSMLSTMTD